MAAPVSVVVLQSLPLKLTWLPKYKPDRECWHRGDSGFYSPWELVNAFTLVQIAGSELQWSHQYQSLAGRLTSCDNGDLNYNITKYFQANKAKMLSSKRRANLSRLDVLVLGWYFTQLSDLQVQCTPWASYQIRTIVGCACAGNARDIFPATDFIGNR